MVRICIVVFGFLVFSILCLGILLVMISVYNNGEVIYYGLYYICKYVYMFFCFCFIDRFVFENCYKVCKFFSFCFYVYDEDD